MGNYATDPWSFHIANTNGYSTDISTTNGQALLQLVPEEYNYSITETNVFPNFNFAFVNCKKGSNPVGTSIPFGKGNIAISPGDAIICYFVNDEIPTATPTPTITPSLTPTPTVYPNPILPPQCGMDIALVLDNSTKHTEPAEMVLMKSAVIGFVNALRNTPTQFNYKICLNSYE